MDWPSILATARDDVGESRNMSVCAGHLPKSKPNSLPPMAVLPTPSNARCAAYTHCHIDSTPGGVRDANVRARDQLLEVVASGTRRGASWRKERS